MKNQEYILLKYSGGNTLNLHPIYGIIENHKDFDISKVSVVVEKLSQAKLKKYKNYRDILYIAPKWQNVGKNIEKLYKGARESLGTITKDEPWGIKALKIDQCDYDGESVKVGVIDTGIDIDISNFDYLKANFKSKNFLSEIATNSSIKNHGTQCAGIICASDSIHDGVAYRRGVARNINSLYLGKINTFNPIQIEDICKAMLWMSEENIDLVSMSFDLNYFYLFNNNENRKSHHIDYYKWLYTEQVKLLNIVSNLCYQASETMFFSSAGNDSTRSKRILVNENNDLIRHATLPTSGSNIFSIGALERSSNSTDYCVDTWQSRGVDFIAPGNGTISVLERSFDQTSASCPFAVGIAALWIDALRKNDFKGNYLAILAMKLTALYSIKSVDSVSDIGFGLIQAPTQINLTKFINHNKWRLHVN